MFVEISLQEKRGAAVPQLLIFPFPQGRILIGTYIPEEGSQVEL